MRLQRRVYCILLSRPRIPVDTCISPILHDSTSGMICITRLCEHNFDNPP